VAGWTATVCEYRYRVPDENCARGLVDALADFGFALVSCSPFRSRWPLPGDEAAGEWIVRAVDEQPYAMTAQGGRERDAVDRAARLVARDYQGYWHGAARCDVSQLAMLLNSPAAYGYAELRTPGARPQIPPIPPEAPALPAATLTLDGGAPLGRDIDLSDLREVSWSTLEHAHGPADGPRPGGHLG
jgi:hypothetical protein